MAEAQAGSTRTQQLEDNDATIFGFTDDQGIFYESTDWNRLKEVAEKSFKKFSESRNFLFDPLKLQLQLVKSVSLLPFTHHMQAILPFYFIMKDTQLIADLLHFFVQYIYDEMKMNNMKNRFILMTNSKRRPSAGQHETSLRVCENNIADIQNFQAEVSRNLEAIGNRVTALELNVGSRSNSVNASPRNSNNLADNPLRNDEFLERFRRSHNIIITGIPESSNTDATVSAILNHVDPIANNHRLSISRLGTTPQANRARPVKVCFATPAVTRTVLHNVIKSTSKTSRSTKLSYICVISYIVFVLTALTLTLVFQPSDTYNWFGAIKYYSLLNCKAVMVAAALFIKGLYSDIKKQLRLAKKYSFIPARCTMFHQTHNLGVALFAEL
nr:unnamed protein product [Callosobruchus chinensis]